MNPVWLAGGIFLITGIEGDVGKGHCYIMTHQSSMASIYEPMFYYTATNDKWYNHLAESYEYNADATELTIYLRKGIEWSNGTPFTANDIAFTAGTGLRAFAQIGNGGHGVATAGTSAGHSV